MRTLEIGCGCNENRFLPGANDRADPRAYNISFPQLVDSDHPLPVEDKTYDFIWVRYALYAVDDNRKAADEITRVAKDKATLVIVDSLFECDCAEDETVQQLTAEYKQRLQEFFNSWNIDTFAIEAHESDIDYGCTITAILTRGWG